MFAVKIYEVQKNAIDLIPSLGEIFLQLNQQNLNNGMKHAQYRLHDLPVIMIQVKNS